MFERLVGFLQETTIEMKKVVWPTRQETVRYTLVVVIASGAVALFLGGLDYVFQKILNAFLF